MPKHSKIMWHIPKRGSIHQIIGALNILAKYDLDGKVWSDLARKKFNQKLAMWGFTDRGRSLSRTATETLEALLKYLGLIFVNPSNRILRITDAGLEVVKEHHLSEPAHKKRKLSETISQMGDVTSEAIKLQMLKLVIANPLIESYCKGIEVAPFRETLRLLLDSEIAHLTPEEMGYILFFMKSEKERIAVKERILDFRKLPESRRKSLIEKYMDTPEGNLTLKQAPTTTYWTQLCMNTGLCETSNGALRLVPGKENEARKWLNIFQDGIPDFGSVELWIEYVGNPHRLEYPTKVTFDIINADRKGVLLLLRQKGKTIALEGVGVNLLVDGKTKLSVPLFPKEKYSVEITDVSSMRSLFKEEIVIDKSAIFRVELPLKGEPEKASKDETISSIKQMIVEGKTLDDDYLERIRNIAIPLGLVDSAEDVDQYIDRRRILLRGGRLEYLVYSFLSILESEKIITNLGSWRGKIEKGIYLPAPGGTLPDISFDIEDLKVGLEVTACTGRLQWKTEAESVTEHLIRFDKDAEKGRKRAIGVFSAPKIEEFMKAICLYMGNKEGAIIVCCPLMDLVALLDEISSHKAKENLLAIQKQG